MNIAYAITGRWFISCSTALFCSTSIRRKSLAFQITLELFVYPILQSLNAQKFSNPFSAVYFIYFIAVRKPDQSCEKKRKNNKIRPTQFQPKIPKLYKIALSYNWNSFKKTLHAVSWKNVEVHHFQIICRKNRVIEQMYGIKHINQMYNNTITFTKKKYAGPA